MKYQIRKRENVTCYLASEIVELDDEAFRNLENNPYTGNSEEEFLNYIAGLDTWDGLPDDLEGDQYDQLDKVKGESIDMKEFANSAHKYENSWFEIGKKSEKYKNHFEVNFSTCED